MRSALCFLALALAPLPLPARMVEQKTWLPVKVVDVKGLEVSRSIMVTIYYDDDAPKPWPALVLNHGRSPKSAERKALGRATYRDASAWFVKRGFVVAVPTRIGYGVTGGDDVENTGPCKKKNYPPGYEMGVVQTLAVLEHLRGWKEVSTDRAVVVGQSFGGTTAIALAARNTPGVQAAINFAGGGGGDPEGRPQNPCSQPALEKLFVDYGKTARIPTLWVYAENDQYMGPKLPRAWFDAFKAEGGKGEFVPYPPLGADGHGLFSRAPQLWQPRVLEFLRANGYPGLK